MSALEIPHEFFDTDVRNNEQLYQAFCNHVYLGQWEFARLSLEILFQKRLQLNTNLEELLADIICNPTAYCTGSKSVPTPFHFALLLVEECRKKQYLDATLGESLKYEATFKYLLAVGDIQPSVPSGSTLSERKSSQCCVCKEFDRIRTNTDAIPSSLLTDSMADFLFDLWLHETPRVHALVRLYLNSPIPSIQLWLIQIHQRALDHCLQQAKSLNNEQHKSNLVDLLLSLHFYACESNAFRSTMRDILKRTVVYASEANDINGQLFNLKLLYRSVLINENLARFVGELESEHRRDLLNNETVVLHFRKKNSFEREDFFWRELYLYLVENKTDLITCVLNDTIVMIKSRDYSSLDQLLNIKEFSSLHLYMFLLGWTHVRSINDAIVLQDSMGALKNKNETSKKCWKLFQSHLEFIRWLHQVRRVDLYHDGVSPLPDTSDFLAMLHTNSPLLLMHRYLDLQTIETAEVLEKLKDTSMNIVDENDLKQRKGVRFLDDPPKESLRLPEISASMIYLGYLAVNSVVQRILSVENDPSTESDPFALTKSYLTQIRPLRFRLELLENIFSLVFIQQSELKVDESADINEPSTYSRSMSLSNSDRFLSSVQSNLTNDSLQASTNLSIKTQVSLRRMTDEVEEDHEDNASVCSSSMSSAGAAHSSMHRSGLLIDAQLFHRLLIFLSDQVTEVRSTHQKINEQAIDRDTVDVERALDKYFRGCSIESDEQFATRSAKLSSILGEAAWRHDLLTKNTEDSSLPENRIDGQESTDSLASNPAIKSLILPLPVRRRKHSGRRRSRPSESSVSSGASLSQQNSSKKGSSSLVSQILSTRDNLLAICLKEGKITEATEVIRLFEMENHTLAVEAKFSKLFRDTAVKLSNFGAPSMASSENAPSTSALAGLATFASSALDNSSLQNEINPIVEAAQSTSVASTLPTSSYFDKEHFVPLTLFDLAINAPSMSSSKTLLDMAQHRLPLPRPLFTSNTASNAPKASSSRMKTLNEMINNYSQLANASNGSFYDLLLDVTIPLEASKATKVTQYYKRLDEHCRQYYLREQNSISIEQQVKSTGELFESDPLARLDLIAYIRNNSNQSKLPSSTYTNYFSIFHNYLQNFRLLLEKFPIQDLSSNVDLSKHSPLWLIHRIVARSSDIDLAQLQLMTSKLNIDISLAVSLNIIRPLFVDKTIDTSTLSSNRRTTLLQQQPIDIFTHRQSSLQQDQLHQNSHSLSTGSLKRQLRRSTTFFRRLTSRVDGTQTDLNSFTEHPEKFIRTLLTRLLDSIRKIIQESGHSHMIIEHVEKLTVLDDYDDILNTLPLLSHLDLDRLLLNDERLCFFTNLYNLLIIIAHVELIRTTFTQITTTSLFRNDLERLLFLLTTRLDVGQLKQVSLFDIRHFLLKQTILIDGLQFELDPQGPFHCYAPTMANDQHVKIGLLLSDCIYSSAPFVILTPELVNEQLQRLTRDFIDKCVVIKTIESDSSMQILLPDVLQMHFRSSKEDIVKFIGEYSSNNDVLCAINEHRSISTEVISSRTDFAISFDYRCCASQLEKHHRRRRTSSLPSTTTITTLASPVDFLPPAANLPNHLIDSRTITFVQEKSPALGQILQIYVQSVVHNQPIETDRTPLKTYFTSLLLPPTLIESTSSIGDEWFRSIVLNDLTYQHDLLLYLSSLLWNQSKYKEIVELFDSLLPSFIVHSAYCQILRDLALLSLIKQTSEPDHAYHYLRKIHDCHLLVHATLTYLPRFDGPTCLKLLQLCLTSCKKSHQDYIPWIQERLNTMYVYKTLCLSALALFTKHMEKISKDDNRLNVSIEDMATKRTTSKCLTWQSAQEHSQRDPLTVVDLFIEEKQFDVGHKWLALLINRVDQKIVNRVRLKLVEDHIHWLLKEENTGNGNKILQIIDTIDNVDDKWHLCTDLISDLSQHKPVSHTKSIPFSRLFIKFRLIQYMLGHFEENSAFFQGQYERSTLSVLVTGLALFFNCIPLEQTDCYVQLVGQPLLIVEQLLMNSSIDIAKMTIETLKVLIEKYSLQNSVDVKQIDQLIELYTKKSVQLNVLQLTEETATIDTKPAQPPAAVPQSERRRRSLIPSPKSRERKGSQDVPPLGRRNPSGGANQFLNSIRQRMSPKTSISSAAGPDSDSSSSIPINIVSSPGTNHSPVSSSIPIRPHPSQQQPSSSFIDYLSTSLSNRFNPNDSHPGAAVASPSTNKFSTGEYVAPMAAPSRKLWISDDEVAVCMCCRESQFSMFNRRHHCRRCGRVVCKSCSQQMTVIKERMERTCKDCYQYMQSNPTATATNNTRPEPVHPVKRIETHRSFSRPISSFKRQSISQLYLNKNRTYEPMSSMLLLGTSLVNETPNALHEDSLLLSSSFSTASPIMRNTRLNGRATISSPQKAEADVLVPPVISDQVQYQLTGTSNDDQMRHDFHYDQSPSISLCLSLIELHSDQYQCGKILINLCDYLSEQLSTKQRNAEIDYGLVLNIIKNLLFTAKMKLMTMVIDDDQIQEQQKLVAACDMYNNLVDILNRLNMANCPLPALNDLLQQDTLRRIRNQLLDDERYQLAMDISTRCNLDTQTIWFQWGMAYLHIGRYTEARDKFEKCLKRTTETADTILRQQQQQQRSSVSQEKILSDIISYLESSLPLKYSMKCQYLADQQIRQSGQIRASVKYLNSLSALPRPSDQAEKDIQKEILFYLTTYSDDAHLLDYYIRHEFYNQALEYKCSLTVFRDHIYLPLLKRNHMKFLFNYILSHPNHSLTHHLKFMCTHLRDKEMHHSLLQLQSFMNDFTNAALTSIKLFTFNRTTYIDLFEKRLTYLQKALECFQQAKIDTEQTMIKIQSTKNKIDLQLELTRYVYTQLKRLGTNGSNVLINCPTLFDSKEAIIKLIFGLITLADTIGSAFSLINRIIQEVKLSPAEVFIPCGEELGKRRDYRSLQQLIQLLRENNYSSTQLHDDIIESCIRQTGSDVEQSREQDTLIQMIKNDDTRINVYMAVSKLRAAYLIAIRLGKEEKVRAIRDDAQKSGQTSVYDMCKKWLENRANEQ